MIERRNHEGYADPTAHAALTKVSREGAHGKIRITFGAVREISFADVILGGKPRTAGNDSI